MNIDNILKLADIVKHSGTFSMMIYVNIEAVPSNGMLCRTPACIAGHAYFAARESKKMVNVTEDFEIDSFELEKTAMEWLGLDEKKAMELFCNAAAVEGDVSNATAEL